MESQEKIVTRVVRFLYDSLDKLRDVMSEVNDAISDLMVSLQRAEKDLNTLGIDVSSRSPEDLAAMIASSRRSGVSSRERLIALLSGQPIKPEKPAAKSPLIKKKPTPTPAAPATPKPAVPTPPKPTVPSPPTVPATPSVPKPPTTPSVPKPPTVPSVPKPPTTPSVPKPPTVPSVPKPPTATPPTPRASTPSVPLPKTPPTPPVSTPPVPRTPPTPAAAPRAGPAGGSGPPTISGLRDEMLAELKRLKSIMKGGK